MNIKELNDRHGISTDAKAAKIYQQFTALLNELRKKDLPRDIVDLTNECIEQINASTFTGTQLASLIKEKQSLILKQTEKQLKIVPKNYYRNLWMLFGMTGIGLPIGVVFGIVMGNIGLLGLGLPIGLAIGLAIGASMDKKALDEGRQLNVEIKN